MEFIAKVLANVSGLLWFTKEPDASGIVGLIGFIFWKLGNFKGCKD